MLRARLSDDVRVSVTGVFGKSPLRRLPDRSARGKQVSGWLFSVLAAPRLRNAELLVGIGILIILVLVLISNFVGYRNSLSINSCEALTYDFIGNNY